MVKGYFRLAVVPRHIVKASEKVLKQEPTTDFVYNEGLRKKSLTHYSVLKDRWQNTRLKFSHTTKIIQYMEKKKRGTLKT